MHLKRVPDHSTLWHMFQALDSRRLFRLMHYLREQCAPCADYLALDSTSFRESQASSYFRTRTGGRRKNWFRGAYAVDTDSQLILAAAADGGHTLNDVCFLQPLKARAQPFMHADTLVLADAGFDAKTVAEHDLIPPIRRGNRLASPVRKARAELVAQARLDGLYGQRWKVETVHSVIKRLFGDAVRSRKRSAKLCEPILKAVIYNIHRLLVLNTLQQSAPRVSNMWLITAALP